MPRVLVAGGGGREHAICWALSRGDTRPDLLCAPGNPGIAAIAECAPGVHATDVAAVVALARSRAIDLAVVGPEAPLSLGLADALRGEGIAVLGPSRAAARLESSKAFAKEVMDEAGVPTAKWARFSEPTPAIELARRFGGRVAVKADGLAAGKGVVVCGDPASASEAVREVIAAYGPIVVEERLEGEELSVIALTDGERVSIFAPAQDHKRVGEGDSGPNTGGMGAYAPAPLGTGALLEEAEQRCLLPVVRALAARGTPFRGVLYAGLMLTAGGPKVLEYNVRLGDPEAQVILPMLDEDPFPLFLAAAAGTLEARRTRVRPGAALTVVLCAEGYPGKPRTGDRIEGLDRAGEAIVFHAGTSGVPGAIHTSGGRVLAVTGLGADLRAAAATAYRAAEAIDWPGRFFRRDVGWRALG